MFDAIVLAGGSARRLDGTDKPGVEIDGVTLLDRVIAAAEGAAQVIVVGPERASEREVRWVREDPPGGGPVAGLAAAVGLVEQPRCLVLAADLPWIAGAVPLLLAGAEAVDVAVLTAAGRRNHLAALWRTDALRSAIGGLDRVDGAAARALYLQVRVREVPDDGGWGQDCDTWADIDAARHRSERR